MSEHHPNETEPAAPAPIGGDAPADVEGDRGAPDPTVGTGSVFAIGCVILLVVAVVVLGAIFFRP